MLANATAGIAMATETNEGDTDMAKKAKLKLPPPKFSPPKKAKEEKKVKAKSKKKDKVKAKSEVKAKKKESKKAKRGPGRPPKEGGAKSIYLHVRTHPDHLNHFKKWAASHKINGKKPDSFSAWVMTALFNEAPAPKGMVSL
jgi:hypothetical protein